MTKTERAIHWMEATAKDDSHGYCQQHRWGADGDYDGNRQAFLLRLREHPTQVICFRCLKHVDSRM